jgi:hypothetical protein
MIFLLSFLGFQAQLHAQNVPVTSTDPGSRSTMVSQFWSSSSVSVVKALLHNGAAMWQWFEHECVGQGWSIELDMIHAKPIEGL